MLDPLSRSYRRYINIPFGTNPDDRILREIELELRQQLTPSLDFAFKQRAFSSSLAPFGKPSAEINEPIQEIYNIWRFKFPQMDFQAMMLPVFSRPWRRFPIEITKAMKTLSARSVLRETRSRLSGSYVSKEMRRTHFYRYGIGVRGFVQPTNPLENMIIRDFSERIFKNAITLGRATHPVSFTIHGPQQLSMARSVASNKMYGIYREYDSTYKKNLATWIARQYVEKLRRYY